VRTSFVCEGKSHGLYLGMWSRSRHLGLETVSRRTSGLVSTKNDNVSVSTRNSLEQTKSIKYRILSTFLLYRYDIDIAKIRYLKCRHRYDTDTIVIGDYCISPIFRYIDPALFGTYSWLKVQTKLLGVIDACLLGDWCNIARLSQR